MKILYIVLISSILSADSSNCLNYLNKSNTAQDELALYIQNDLKVNAHFSAKEALMFSIKAKVACERYVDTKKIDLKIIELNSLVQKYK